MNKFLIVGIGNIGKEYDETRHNIGFTALDWICKEFGGSFETKKLGDVSRTNYKGKTFILLKPSTYVNLSGKSVRYWLNKEKIKTENLLVISDDLNLDFGTIRIRTKGSDGGHNGLKNISELLNTNHYNRLRFGIGGNFNKEKQSDYVLSKWSKEEKSKLITFESIFYQIICSYAISGIESTMNQFNK
tara:strand:- start:5662 stop:6225 length:564 start_codon:yes stop_codon:yes gene_type:complete